MMAWEDVTGANPNLTQFLSFLGKAEGADWDTIVGGGKFSDFSQHPNVVGLRTKEGPSTAAGRYQITGTTYRDVAPKLGITDFSPESQNRIAVELIRRGGALEDVMSGNFENAIKKLGSTWASLPSSPYSQPKRDWNFVKANLQSSGGNDGWETVAPQAQNADAGWEDIAPPARTAPAAARTAPAAAQATAPAAAAAPTSTAAPNSAPAAAQRSVAGNLGLGTRNVMEGLELAATYPVRAVGEAAAGIAGLFGNKQLADTLSRTVGMRNRGAGALAADSLGLAKPETRAEKIIAEGTKAAAGLVTGTGVARLVDRAPQAIKAAAGILTPGTSGSAGQVARDVGIFGGLGASLEAAPAETAAGLAVLAGGKAAAGRVVQNRAVDKFIKEAGSDEGARIAAEVTRDFRRVAANPDIKATNDAGQATVATVLRNQQASRYVDDVVEAIKRVEPSLLKKFDVATLLKPDRVVTQTELFAMRNAGPSGDVLADAVQKYQKAMALTAPTPASGSLGAKLLRFGIENTPRAAAAATGATAMGPAGLLLGAVTPSASGFAQRITGKATVPEVITKLSSDKRVSVADAVLRRLGPSKAAQGAEDIADMARKAEASAAAQKVAKEAEKAAKATAGPAAPKGPKAPAPQVSIAELQAKDPTYMLGLGNRFGPPRNADQMSEFSNVMRSQMERRAAQQAASAEKSRLIADVAKGPQVDPRIQVLQDTRRPLSGAFQELLPGGRSNLNLNSDEAIDALRLVSRQFKERPVGQAAQGILRSGNVADESAFYGLQNQIRKLQEQGVLGGRQAGALSDATAANPVRNQVSYAEAVRTAGAAADLARSNAPSKELAQFATRVAGIKSPEAKAKAVADRLSKTADPAEQAFLTNFVEPLAQFGKK